MQRWPSCALQHFKDMMKRYDCVCVLYIVIIYLCTSGFQQLNMISQARRSYCFSVMFLRCHCYKLFPNRHTVILVERLLAHAGTKMNKVEMYQTWMLKVQPKPISFLMPVSLSTWPEHPCKHECTECTAHGHLEIAEFSPHLSASPRWQLRGNLCFLGFPHGQRRSASKFLAEASASQPSQPEKQPSQPGWGQGRKWRAGEDLRK